MLNASRRKSVQHGKYENDGRGSLGKGGVHRAIRRIEPLQVKRGVKEKSLNSNPAMGTFHLAHLHFVHVGCGHRS